MTCIVPRSCREVSGSDSPGGSQPPAQPVETCEDEAAYVLLGPPGSGKTTVFEHEAKRLGGICVTARDFLTFDDKREWRDTTLFIDGLDESRAGTADGRTPLDSIRAKLDRMGRPRFRLSCREADWFGANDSDHLKSVSPDGSVTVMRLEPLSGDDARKILLANLGIEDPDDFIASARDRGLQGLLVNPQSLRMLAIAVGSDSDWPKTRMKAFDMACRALLQEHNEDHRIAQPDRGGVSDLMHACGKLFALQLLTGSAGYSRSGNGSEQDFLGLDQVAGEDPAILRSGLQSKLFESPTQHLAVPVHRQIAEFLAARFLAGLVGDGLPVGRILALMTGHDGVVVSELRGLSAWLAAHSKVSRREVIARDPLGTVLYGDASGFSPAEKRSLLDGLQREAKANPWFIATLHLDSRFGDLVSSDMEDHFRDILADPSREDSWQSYLIVLLEALLHGERLPKLADPLKKLIRDGTWWPGIRVRALDLHVRQFRHDTELRDLAAEIHAGKVSDPDDRLLGCLMSALYPAVISETEVMRFLRIPQRPDYINEYDHFWTVHLAKRSTRRQLTVLLDDIVDRYDSLLAYKKVLGLHVSFVRRLHASLLARFLSLSGEEPDLARLFNWLEPAATDRDCEFYPDVFREEYRDVWQWLMSRPGTWKSLLAMGLTRCMDQFDRDEPYGFANCMRKEEHGRLLGVARPSDLGLWCLDQAVVAEDANAAEWLLGEIAACLRFDIYNEGLSREVALKRLAGHADLLNAFDRKFAELEAPAFDESVSGRRSQAHSRSDRPNWHAKVKPHKDELLGNRAVPALLHELAKAYFGGYLNVRGRSPRERLDALLDGDTGLVEAVLVGFRKTMERDDLPSVRQVIRLGNSNRTHLLALPFMAGLEETSIAAPLGKLDVDERLLRLALAVHYTVPMWPTAQAPADRPPGWFGWMLANCPDVVADVLVRSVLSKLRNSADSLAGLQELANSPDHADVARIAALPLLQRFPVRCTSGQLSSLSHLMLAARRHCDVELLLELIDEKHAHPGMTVAQRIHWLVCALCIAPETYVDRLEAYATVTERRIRFLAEAVTRLFDRSPDLRCRQSVPALRLLIRLIGASCRPYSYGGDSDEGMLVTAEMNAADRVRGFIDELSAVSAEDASRALEAMSSDHELRPWHTLLRDAAYHQGALRREAEFVYGDVAQVGATLDHGPPANVADLAALTFEHLCQIARNIRHGSASGWRQYWNVNGDGQVQNPRPENVCRDLLSADMATKMQQFGVDVQREANYADDKRADIRVSLGNFNVPVEVKRSCHRSLWSAIRLQLIARYTRDPGTGGHGIYLVFWFGDAEGCRPTSPMTGPPPIDAQELERLLMATLSAEEKLKIRICVVDVADSRQR